MNRPRPALTFIRHVYIWNYWAFGVSRYRRQHPSKLGKLTIVTYGIGPLRIQFFDTSQRWVRKPKEEKDGIES